MPRQYKVLNSEEWSIFPGKLAGCEQPGYYSADARKTNDTAVLAALERGEPLENIMIDQGLLDDLDYIYNDGIRVIYSLLPSSGFRNQGLIKHLWEHRFSGTQYITRIDGIAIGVEDFLSPNQQQFEIITRDAIEHLERGENILFHCQGGMGRTGTLLAAIYMKAHQKYEASEAIQYIRDNYHESAIESEIQCEQLKEFGDSFKSSAHDSSVATFHDNVHVEPLPAKPLVAFSEESAQKIKSTLGASLKASEDRAKNKHKS